MTQKNNTPALLVSLAVTVALVAAGGWWLTRSAGIDLGRMLQSGQTTPTSTPTGSVIGGPSGLSSSAAQTFAKVADVPSGLFSYGGSTTWAPIRRETDLVLPVVWPEFKLRYTAPTSESPGSSAGIRMLLADQISFAQASRPLEDQEIKQAESRGYKLLAIPVAIDGIAIAVNPNLNLPGLTISQLQQIYTGQVTNWSQVGGPSQPITLYSRRPADSGTVEFFIQDVLNKQPLPASVQFISTTTQALRKVSTDPGGIYFASAPEVVGQCTVKSLPLGRKAGEWVTPYQLPLVPLSACPGQRNQLNREGFQAGNYPLTRRLFVIVKQNGQLDEQAGRAYAALMLTDQGQDLIAKAGYVRIR